jgi:aminocarboxymuconate-semialdehyde decarboxylase
MTRWRRIVMGTDYPFDMADPHPVRSVASVPGPSDADRNEILGGNAPKLLRL